MTDRNLDMEIMDAILEAPFEFFCGGKAFYIYPVSFGKLQILQRQLSALGVNVMNIQLNATLEAIRLVKEKRSECIRVIVLATCRSKEEVYSSTLINERLEFFGSKMDDNDIATLLIYIFMNLDKSDYFMKKLGLDKENERKRKVLLVKSRNDRNSIDFGGRTIIGSFILPLIDVGLTYDEIIWERSHTLLRLAVADRITSIFLTDDERRKLPASLLNPSVEAIQGDNPENKELIHKMDWR